MAIHRLKQRFVDTVTQAGMYADGANLYLQVSEGGGAKSWIFRYNRSRLGEAGEAHMGLGPTHTYSLDEARELARKCRQQLQEGIDPLATRKAEKLAKQLEESKDITFAECAADYLKFKSSGPRPLAPKTAATTKRWLNKHAIPLLGNLPIRTVTSLHIAKVLNPIEETSPKTAGMLRGLLQALFERARRKGRYADENPATREALEGLVHDDRLYDVNHFASLPYNKIAAMVAELRTPISETTLGYSLREAAEAAEVDRSAIQVAIYQGKLVAHRKPGTETKYNPPWFIQPAELNKVYPIKKTPTKPSPIRVEAFILQYGILTGVRPTQARMMHWSEWKEDAGEWVCPAHRHKAGRHTRRPYVTVLSEAATAILETMRAKQKADGIESEFVFAQWNDAYLHCTVGQPPSDTNVRKHLARITDEKIAVKCTVHGFRTTFGSWAEDAGYQDKDIERALGHAAGFGKTKVSRIYRRDATRHNPIYEMMEAWADFCGFYKPLSDNVLPFKQAT